MRKKYAYTLAEIITVILIITVIVAISIKLTKAKLNNITSYIYYNAYKTVNTVVSEMLLNFKLSDERYLPLHDEDSCATINEDAPECPEGQEWNGAEKNCHCTPNPATIPRTGANFCDMFESMVNTNSSLIEGTGDIKYCQGDAVPNTNNVDYSTLKPDIILRNGMCIYNISQDPTSLEDWLEGNSNGTVYADEEAIPEGEDMDEIDVDTYGYRVYVDIDGEKGTSTYGDDVFAFLVTMSGKVIPVWSDPPAGGNNRNYLAVGVSHEVIDANGRHTNWLLKSSTFQKAACQSGYIKEEAEYCQNWVEEDATENDFKTVEACKTQGHDCIMHVIAPVKWFN